MEGSKENINIHSYISQTEPMPAGKVHKSGTDSRADRWKVLLTLLSIINHKVYRNLETILNSLTETLEFK